MAPLIFHYIRDVKTEVNAYPADMDLDLINRERTIAYGVLAMLVALWFTLALVVKFGGGRDPPELHAAPGVALKDPPSAGSTKQASR